MLIFFNSVGLPYKLLNILAWSWYRDAMLLKISIRKISSVVGLWVSTFERTLGPGGIGYFLLATEL